MKDNRTPQERLEALKAIRSKKNLDIVMRMLGQMAAGFITGISDVRLERLSHELQKAIIEERYEDAALIRDEIKKAKLIHI